MRGSFGVRVIGFGGETVACPDSLAVSVCVRAGS
jgi:hypothetical protein